MAEGFGPSMGRLVKIATGTQLRRNVLSGTVVNALSGIVVFASYPIFLHFLGYELYGLWLVLATVLAVAQLANFGLGQAVSKLVAEEHGKDRIAVLVRSNIVGPVLHLDPDYLPGPCGRVLGYGDLCGQGRNGATRSLGA